MNDLLEDAIRAGIERGMDEAPVVDDLARRVRATPLQHRRWPWLAATAAASVAVLALGLAALVHQTSHPIRALPGQTTTQLIEAGPPYAVVTAQDDGTTAARSIGSWVPVWISGYDGPWKPSNRSADPVSLMITKIKGRAGFAQSQFALTTHEACAVQGGWLAPNGSFAGSSFGDPLVGCIIDNTSLSTVFISLTKRLVRVGVSDDGVLTMYDAKHPIAQFVHPGTLRSAAHGWSVTGQLPAEALGTWNYNTPSGAPVQAYLTLQLGGGLTMTGPCSTKYNGSYLITPDGHARFTWRMVQQNTNCLSPITPWTPPTNIDRVGLYKNELTLYDPDGGVLATFRQVNTGNPDIVGDWTVRDGSEKLGGVGSITFGADGWFVGVIACNSTSGHYRVGADGTMTADHGGTTLVGCRQPVSDQGSSMADVKRVALAGDVLTLYGDDGILAHLIRQ